MTSLSLLIYGISTITNLGTFLAVVGMFCFTTILIVILISYLDDSFKKTSKWLYRLVITTIICGFISIFIPDKEYLIMIAGSEVANVALQQDVVKNAGSQVSGLSSDAVNLLRNYIQKQTEELNSPKKSN